jgi:DNA-binding NtrC family response regulator
VRTVLLVDDNLGFAFWLGRALDRAGYETWPARSVPAAESLLSEVRLVVDLLVINASLPRARLFAAHLGRSRADFKVIAICEGSDDVQTFFEASAVYKKPEAINATTESEWVQIVRGVRTPEVTRHELRVPRKPTDSDRAF